MNDALSVMRAGPVLDLDSTVVIPSRWHNPDAAQLWKSQGFRFNPDLKEWLRDARKPAQDGRVYPPNAWLQAARRRFYEFYPELHVTCRRCGEPYIPPANWKLFYCPQCMKGES
jgi:hypothetical protein